MDRTEERRSEKRLQYKWPVWFAEDLGRTLSQGLMLDISSGGMAFSCNADEHCPHPDQQITTQFSIPRFGDEDSCDMTSFKRTGRVRQVDNISSSTRRVAVKFDQPLSFKPSKLAAVNQMLSEGSQP